MPIDPSIYGQLKTTQTNPLQMASDVQGLIGQLNQNRLFQAKQAAGQQVQQAIGADGQLDENALMRGMAGDPRAALAAGETANESLARQAQHVQITGQQLDQAIKKAGALSAATQTLLANPNAGPTDAARVLGELVTSKVLSPQEAIGEAQNIPQAPGEFQKWVQDHSLNFMTQEARLKAVWGEPQEFDVGDKKAIVSVSPMPGVAPRQIGEIQKGLSPGEAVSPAYSTVGPNGAPGVVLKGDLAHPATGLVGQGGAPAASAAAPGLGAQPRVVGPPAGTVQAMESAGSVSGTANANSAANLMTAAEGVPNRKALLGQMRGQLENFTPGPASDWSAHLSALAQQFHVPFSGASAKGTAAIEEFRKLATQIAQQQYQAIGGTGTDAKLDSARHSSPDTMLSKEGNEQIIALLKGNEDAIAAKNDAWQKWMQAGHGPQTYGQFTAQFNKVWDPRVFQSQYMSPAERQTVLKGMSKDEQAKFQNAYKLAAGLGWIK